MIGTAGTDYASPNTPEDKKNQKKTPGALKKKNMGDLG